MVTGATGVQPVAPAQPPVWCEDDPSKCVKGAKQMVYFNALDGNNINVDGKTELDGSPRSPTYNAKLGWAEGDYFYILHALTLFLNHMVCS